MRKKKLNIQKSIYPDNMLPFTEWLAYIKKELREKEICNNLLKEAKEIINKKQL